MGISDSVDLVKKALDIKTELARVEDKEALIEAKSALIDLKAELLELREENQNLHQKLGKKASLMYKGNVYWQHNAEDPGPFCPRCWEVDDRQVHMVHWSGNSYHCNACKAYVDVVAKPS